jgi:hypothetical protein
MKRWVLLLTGIAIGIVAALLFLKDQTSQPIATSPKNDAQQNAAVAKALANQNSNTVEIIKSNFARVQSQSANLGPAVAITTPPAGSPSALQFTNLDPEIVMQNMSRAIHQYGEMFGGNPVGNNQEITSQLSGKNPRHINLVTEEAGMRVNGNGELMDPWGTPYFFHQISGSDTEIRSAGPDKIMWTADDVVEHSGQ